MRQELLGVEGVVGAVVDFDSERAEVTYRTAVVLPERLVEAVNRTAFRARLLEPEDEEDDR